MYIIIGGSGFYDFLENSHMETIETPFGVVDIERGTLDTKEVAFLPRHGKKHSIMPSAINYRANIFAAHLLNAKMILTTNAVGSIRKEIPPGSLAIPDQILDFTSGRQYTFFDGGPLKIVTRNGTTLQGVVHTDVTHPYDIGVRTLFLDRGKEIGLDLHDGGTMVAYNGPRYETPAEIDAARILGGDLAGMTTAPETFLAKELEIPYATVAVVTNYAAGMQKSITHEEVDQMFRAKIEDIKSLFSKVITASE
ncbi:MAG: MTAP family purine nucleoside phosphorylase [Candidatus Kariarchaeaceae archaeon]|jgi:5'-methylthioadenosine phosphorylase